MDHQLECFLSAIRQQESGGDYQVVNATSGALGAYQVMPANLPGWLFQAGLPPLTPQGYLANPAAQDRLAETVIGGYTARYGWGGAAAMWYSGQPDSGKTYGNPPVYQYVSDVMYLFLTCSGGPVGVFPQPGLPAFRLPPPNPADWSPTIRGTGQLYVSAGHVLATAAKEISSMR